MNLKIYKDYADYTKCDSNTKLCVFVEFPNCISKSTNKPFRWMPSYKQLREIATQLNEIEKISWRTKEKK